MVNGNAVLAEPGSLPRHNRPLLLLGRAFLLALGLLSGSAAASIYGYIDEHGAAHFATEQLDARYKLFLLGDASLSSAAAPAGPGKPELLRRLSQHPNLKKFDRLIRLASNEFAVDPALLKAIMAAESAFDPDALSPKGAIGLMQIMPSTAGQYGLQADAQQTLEEKLTNPKTNIRLGARYLRDLFRMFPNEPHLVLAAYNAGQGAVHQHNNRIPPYAETRTYVQVETQLLKLWEIALDQVLNSPLTNFIVV